MHFGKDSKARRGGGELHRGEKGRFPVCSDPRLLIWGRWKWLTRTGVPMALVRSAYSLLGNEIKIQGSCQLLVKSWPFEANCREVIIIFYVVNPHWRILFDSDFLKRKDGRKGG